MPFIGNQPALSYTSFAKQDFTTSATTSYTLDNPVTNANELALFINFVRQEPTTAYTASGTSLTLTSATSASDDMYCVFLGKAVQTVNPPNGSVGASQISDGSIALAKLSATGTKDATTFLRGDNTFAAAGLNGWSEDGANNNLLPANASAGIYLGVNSATASNLLDDYEEGTWTPAVNQGTINNVGSTYTKIGNKVTIWSSINTFSNRTSTETVEVSGLPFSIASQNQNRVVGSIVMNYSNKLVHASYSRSNSTIAFYISIAGSFVPLKFNDLNNSASNIIFTATYEAA